MDKSLSAPETTMPALFTKAANPSLPSLDFTTKTAFSIPASSVISNRSGVKFVPNFSLSESAFLSRTDPNT